MRWVYHQGLASHEVSVPLRVSVTTWVYHQGLASHEVSVPSRVSVRVWVYNQGLAWSCKHIYTYSYTNWKPSDISASISHIENIHPRLVQKHWKWKAVNEAPRIGILWLWLLHRIKERCIGFDRYTLDKIHTLYMYTRYSKLTSWYIHVFYKAVKFTK